MKKVSILFLVLLAAACMPKQNRVASITQQNITIEIPNDLDAFKAATAQAEDSCSRTGRHAMYQNIADINGGKAAIFNCVATLPE